MRAAGCVIGGLLLLSLAACSGQGSAGGPAERGSAATRAASPTSAASTGLASPAIDDDFPDPDVLRVGDAYFAYATNANTLNVRVARSTDLRHWELLDRDALPALPSWVIKGKTWAPDVSEPSPGRFLMYVTATNADPTLQCIAVATATAPEGPFRIVGDRMLVCPRQEGGAIDAATFTDDDGERYLLWKNDGNCCGMDTWLQIAPLSADGLRLTGPARRLVKQDQPWEGALIEAPTLRKRGQRYVLLYSGNDYGGADYAIGYATARSLDGPYLKAGEPLLSTRSSGGAFLGPGGQDIVTAPDGHDRLVFHAWDEAKTYRAMHVIELDWQRTLPRAGKEAP
jgi:beta-xylosidase